MVRAEIMTGIGVVIHHRLVDIVIMIEDETMIGMVVDPETDQEIEIGTAIVIGQRIAPETRIDRDRGLEMINIRGVVENLTMTTINPASRINVRKSPQEKATVTAWKRNAIETVTETEKFQSKPNQKNRPIHRLRLRALLILHQRLVVQLNRL
jgi:hypothetical protein